MAESLTEILSAATLGSVLEDLRTAASVYRDTAEAKPGVPGSAAAMRHAQQLDRAVRVIEYLCHPTPNTIINAMAVVETPTVLGELATTLIVVGNKRHRLIAEVRKAIEGAS